MSHVNRNAATRRSTYLNWQEALAILESCSERGVPVPFAIAFVTADEGRDTGGEIIRMEKAIWHVKGGRVQKNESFQRIAAQRITSQPAASVDEPGRNWIRRIRAVDSDQIRNVHVHLIQEINGQPVLK